MEEIFHEAVKALIIASAAAAGPLVVAVLVQLFRRANIQLSAAQQDRLRQIVQNILIEVEEWASHRLKADIPVTSGQKLSRAVDEIVDALPKLTEAQAESLVRQELPKLGLGSAAPPIKDE